MSGFSFAFAKKAVRSCGLGQGTSRKLTKIEIHFARIITIDDEGITTVYY